MDLNNLELLKKNELNYVRFFDCNYMYYKHLKKKHNRTINSVIYDKRL
jgi:hypothetical protein